MNYEVNGRDDFEKNSLDSGDLQITGIASNHVVVKNREENQSVIYSLGIAATFPASWSPIGPLEEVTVRMGGSTQINFRKKVYYRNILRNDDNTLRLNDITATITVDQVDL